MIIGRPATASLDLNSSYSRRHCARANGAFATMTTTTTTVVGVAVVVPFGQPCERCHRNYCFGSFRLLHCRPWQICGPALHFALTLPVLLTVNLMQSVDCHRVVPVMLACVGALAVAENAFDESIVRTEKKSYANAIEIDNETRYLVEQLKIDTPSHLYPWL